MKKKITWIEDSETRDQDVTFQTAKFESIHRWFPYLEGFAEKFIEDILNGIKSKPKTIYEPFAGSGTLPVFGLTNGIDIYYSEVNPFLQNLIQTKIQIIELNIEDRQKLSSRITKAKSEISKLEAFESSELLRKTYRQTFGECIYFNETNFDLILKFKTLVNSKKDATLRAVLNVSACEALLHSSFLKRAGDIRYKKKSEWNQIVNFRDRVLENLERINEDILNLDRCIKKNKHKFTPNAKFLDPTFINKVDVVITSPPYLNGTNYIRNTKLELWFLGYLKEKSDLSHYRGLVVTSGINDVKKEQKTIALPKLEKYLNDKDLWYDKRIPKMINDYFFDMDLTIKNLFVYLKSGGLAYIDIGDSIYGGIHIKTDEILIDIFKRNGFLFKDNVLLRKRKSKSGVLVKQTLIIVQKP